MNTAQVAVVVMIVGGLLAVPSAAADHGGDPHECATDEGVDGVVTYCLVLGFCGENHTGPSCVKFCADIGEAIQAQDVNLCTAVIPPP
jgi:hypothetical protein